MENMTISEKILARASGKKKVTPGEIVFAKPGVVVINDSIGPTFIKALTEEVGLKKVKEPDKIVVGFDHFVPAPSLGAAETQKMERKFVQENGIKAFFDVGRHGINHQLMAEKGFARPGILYVGDDTHAITLGAFGAFAVAVGYDIVPIFATGECWLRVPESIKLNLTGNFRNGVMTRDLILLIVHDLGYDGALYKVIEFTGPAVEAMSIDSRMVLCNLVNQTGAKTGIINPDEKTISYVKERTKEPFEAVRSDLEATYEKEIDYDISNLRPQVAAPPSPINSKDVADLEGVEIDQAYIGSCASGRLEDLRITAKILKNKKVHPRVRMIVIPSSQEIYLNAAKEGLLEDIVRADGVVCAPSCGPCGGGHSGVLASSEVCIATGVLNYPGRMGSVEAKIYLASPATVAASAVNGKITDPTNLLKRGEAK